MRFEDVERVALDYIDFRYGRKKDQERDDQLLASRTGLFVTAAKPDGLNRGFKVTAKQGAAGLPEFKAARGSMTARLEVAILPRKEYTIAFKFLRHLDPSGKVINATRWTPDDVPWFMTRLNWTFGAQTNIFFTSVEAAWFTVNEPWTASARSFARIRAVEAARRRSHRAFSSATTMPWIPRRPGST